MELTLRAGCWTKFFVVGKSDMLEDHTSSAVRGCFFILFTTTLHIGGRYSIRNPRTRHAVVTGTHIHGILKDTKL